MGQLFSFSGRVGRSGFWMVTVAGVVLYVIFVAWMASLDPWKTPQVYRGYNSGGMGIYWGPTSTKVIFALFALAWLLLAIVGLAVSVRRWHDHGKSGWWVLIGLVPIVGGIYSFVMQGCMPGESGPNQYGQALGSTFSNGTTYQTIARPRDPLQTLAIATVISLIGSTITIVVLGSILSSGYVEFYHYRNEPEFRFGHFLLVCIAAFSAWLVSSRYSRSLVDQLGFRHVSIIADIVCAIGVVVAVIWFRSFVLVLLFVFFGIALRLAALTAYRSMTPTLSKRFGLSPEWVDALFDTFPYCALLIGPLLVPPLWRLLWEPLWQIKIHDFEWLYVAFFAFSAILVAVAVPSDAPAQSAGVVPHAAPEPKMKADGPIEDAVSWN